MPVDREAVVCVVVAVEEADSAAATIAKLPGSLLQNA
jgi:hypothetical protein